LGQLTLAVVNDAPREFDLAVELRGLTKPVRLYRYGVTTQDRDRADLQIAPQRDFPQTADQPTLRDQLAPRSVTVYSTYQLAPADPGIVAE